jgi:hypothetical protein
MLRDPFEGARSDRWIALLCECSHPTVRAIRADLEARGVISERLVRIGSDGKLRRIDANRKRPSVTHYPVACGNFESAHALSPAT